MIFYFSATGNSKQVATQLAQITNEKLIDVTDCLTNGRTDFEVQSNERIGFVTPTYFWGLPVLMVDFVNRLQLKGYSHQYVYMVSTYGSFCGGTHKHLGRLLKPKGIALDGVFSIKMVDEWTPIFDLSNQEKNKRVTAAAKPAIYNTCMMVAERAKGNFMKWPVPDLLCRAFYIGYGISRKTSNFYVLDSCTGCGLCEKNCPLGAITLKDGKPTWTKDKCAICLRCLHQCPQFAIQYGHFTKKHGQFVNRGEAACRKD